MAFLRVSNSEIWELAKDGMMKWADKRGADKRGADKRGVHKGLLRSVNLVGKTRGVKCKRWK